ncbi:MAG: MOSC domain-containing protein [Sandaracinaceae bacterium]|nr:MOSC domain-containing protein [Sandaracinaceae bacterium]
MRVTGLFVYPIKSCGGVSLPAAEVTRAGLRHDRRLMVVDGHGHFLSQRTHPRLGRVSTRLEATGVRALSPEGELFVPFDFAAAGGSAGPVQVWRDTLSAVVHPEGTRFFREVLELPDASLVALPPGGERAVNPSFGSGDDRVGFADAYPILLMGDSSVRDLEARAGVALDMRRFRPNVTFEGAPYAEDRMAGFRAGGLHFRGVKRCDRCVLTTLHPDTQERGLEPLRTLAGYRRGDDGKVYLGMNVIPDAEGTLRVGDLITDVTEREPHP